ncbi:MAG: LysM peptidoglycan-binding domain-containing protein [Bacteroidaceae bacterium]|nr:LysM peptidoglycan-binding domain-containing protein [Bacteroidaceae bacterium]
MKLCRYILFVLTLIVCSAAHSQSNYFVHTVTKGQTMYSISRMYGVTQDTIIKLNPGSEIMIRVGQSLRIPQKSNEFHTIMAGETLYRLSINYKVSIKDICDANPGLSADNFKAGQVIYIPQAKKQEAKEENSNLSQAFLAVAQTELAESSTVLKDTTRYKTVYTVKGKESLSKIARIYGVTQAELIAANNNLSNSSLRPGLKVNIPYSTSEKKIKKNSLSKAEQQLLAMDNDAFIDAGRKALAKDIPEIINVSLLLPFHLDTIANADERKKMVEFYQGILMALDTIKHDGISVKLSVYDTGVDTANIDHILQDPEFGQSNIIFGPKYPSHIEQVAQFAAENRIINVLPLTSETEIVYNNQWIYQLNTPSSFQLSKIYDRFLSIIGPEAQVIFLNNLKDTVDNEFCTNLKPLLERNQIPYLTMVIDTPVYRFTDTLLVDTLDYEHIINNVFVINSPENTPLVNFLPIMQIINRTKHPYARTMLFGYPNYQTYASDLLDQLHEANTYFYTWFYNNTSQDNTLDFYERFRRSFMRQPMVSFPSFAQYGYDMANWFIRGYKKFGQQLGLYSNQVEYKPLHIGIALERISPWGGMINNKVFFVHLDRRFGTSVIDFENDPQYKLKFNIDNMLQAEPADNNSDSNTEYGY